MLHQLTSIGHRLTGSHREEWSRQSKVQQSDGCGESSLVYISHGQADVERGFSVNKYVVNETRVTLKQHTISAIRTVNDVINKYKELE